MVVVICIGICIMDFVLNALSDSNHEMMPTCKNYIVYDGASATYNFWGGIGGGAWLADPQESTHQMMLFFMASRGAWIAQSLVLSAPMLLLPGRCQSDAEAVAVDTCICIDLAPISGAYKTSGADP